MIKLAKKKKELTLQDGFDKDTGKFDTAILLKMFPKARYYFILGGRGWGKTYPTIKLSIEDAMSEKGAFAYLRRYKDAISDTFLQDLMAPHKELVDTISNGQWNSIGYWRKRWSLEQWGWQGHREGDATWERIAKNPIPIGGAFAMNTWENAKGADFGADKNGVKNIILDEAVSAGGDYIKDEWQKFQNVISSLVRENWDKDTKIWLLANPVSKYACPYFRNMGITKEMMKEPGVREIVYPKDEFGRQMSCVFCYLGVDKEESKTALTSARNLTYSTLSIAKGVFETFFAFPNSKGTSKSITHGSWELADSNQLPSGIYNNSEEIEQTFFVTAEEIIGCKIMQYIPTGVYYLFFYPASKVKDKTYYFTHFQDLSEYAIIGQNTGHPMSVVIDDLWKKHHIYYADNTTADMMHGWMKEASKLVF